MEHERYNIEARLHRYLGRDRNRTLIWVRHYARVETAVARCSTFMIDEGKVGDVIEFTLKKNGDQVALIYMPLLGEMKTNWNRSEAKRLRSAAIMAGIKL